MSLSLMLKTKKKVIKPVSVVKQEKLPVELKSEQNTPKRGRPKAIAKTSGVILEVDNTPQDANIA